MDEVNGLIRPFKESDIAPARRIMRLAFGTFAGAADPENYRSDVDFIAPRWRADQTAAFAAEMDLTDSIYPGLNVEREVRAVHAQGLGDTVLVYNDGNPRELTGFAVCHCGPGTEAGNNKGVDGD